MFYKEIGIKQGLSYISFCPLRFLYISKFIIMATSLRTNDVVVTRVHCISDTYKKSDQSLSSENMSSSSTVRSSCACATRDFIRCYSQFHGGFVNFRKSNRKYVTWTSITWPVIYWRKTITLFRFFFHLCTQNVASDQGLHCLLNNRKSRVKQNSLKSPFSTIFQAYTQRQSIHQCCQCFDWWNEVL